MRKQLGNAVLAGLPGLAGALCAAMVAGCTSGSTPSVAPSTAPTPIPALCTSKHALTGSRDALGASGLQAVKPAWVDITAPEAAIDPSTLLLLRDPSPSSTAIPATIQVNVSVWSGKGDVKSAAQQLLSRAPAGAPKPSTLAPCSVAGGTGVAYSASGEPVDTSSVILLHGGYIYTVTLTATPADNSKGLTIVGDFLASWKFSA